MPIEDIWANRIEPTLQLKDDPTQSLNELKWTSAEAAGH